ncbi:MAG: type VI secretion system baseplate subunit TssG [Caulobacteraceae bacterium]|nr:type VI secretion system baseplate subunit TssG [Caulobacteraceae bacterium]
MARENRPKTDHLGYLRQVETEVRRFGFFALMRALESRAPDHARIGESRLPAQNIIDLAHTPSQEFPGATIDQVEWRASGRPTVRSNFLGLTGPMGALPLHLTEFAQYERRYAKTQPFGRFLDLLTDRMLQFFYRAWADAQPVVHADRPQDDRFAGYLAAISGAQDGLGDANQDFPAPNFSANGRLHYAGLFASRRSAGAIQDGLSHMLGVPVRITEFVARWSPIEPQDRSRLSRGESGFNQLGVDTVLGGRVRLSDSDFRVTLKAADLADYEAFLPGGARYQAASQALTALSPSHLDWELELEIDEQDARAAHLNGAARLGWTGWMTPGARTGSRADARLRRPTRPRIR